MRTVEIAPTFEAWQAAARELLRDGVPPTEVAWRDTATQLPSAPSPAAAATGQGALPGMAGAPAPAARVPRKFVDLARAVAQHPEAERWPLLYAVLWRLVHEDKALLERERDSQVAVLLRMRQELQHSALRPPVSGARPWIPAGADLATLADAATRCQGCDLYRHATQSVFGRGPADARVVLVGEQPGDQEDRQGAPFVGPAGEVLDRALVEAGIERQRCYVTNAVKHFKFVERGKRRIHQTPGPVEISACLPWLEAELDVIKAQVLVCLGATASRAILGSQFRLMRDHGRFLATRFSTRTIATLHPSAVLRGEDEATQRRLYAMLTDDLRRVAQVAGTRISA